MEDVFPKSYLFVTLLSGSLQFQKQLMTKSETRFGFKPLRNHWCINRKINSNKYKSQKEKRVVSPSLSYLHGLTEKSLASGYYCYLRCVLYLVKDVKKLLGAYEVFRFQVSKVSCRWIFRFVLYHSLFVIFDDRKTVKGFSNIFYLQVLLYIIVW